MMKVLNQTIGRALVDEPVGRTPAPRGPLGQARAGGPLQSHILTHVVLGIG